MRILKSKIKIIPSLPPTSKKNKTPLNYIFYILLFIIIGIILYFSYIKLSPYINAVNIKKISGKKINITECNTKDYVIIGNDKAYSMQLTNINCETQHYEGNIKIKNNEIIFNKNIKGQIDSDYNIIINNKKFESDDDNE